MSHEIKIPSKEEAIKEAATDVSDDQSIGERFFDQTMIHASLFTSVENDLVRKQEKLLKEFANEVLEEIEKIDPTGTENLTRQVQRKLLLFKNINRDINNGYAKIERNLRSTLQKIGILSATVTVEAIEDVLPFPFKPKTANPDIIRQLIDNNPFGGTKNTPPRLLSEWIKSLKADIRKKARDQIDTGIFAQESKRQIKTRMSKIFKTATSQQLEAIVRTTMGQIVSDARLEGYRRNKDVIKGLEVSTARDARVCVICASASGQTFKFGDEPWPFNLLLHINCRCDWIPVTFSSAELGLSGPDKRPKIFKGFNLNVPTDKSSHKDIVKFLEAQGKPFEEFQKDKKGNILNFKTGKKRGQPIFLRKSDMIKQVDKITAGYRGKMVGSTLKDISYPVWFAKQPEFFQRLQLTPRKFELFKKNKLSFGDFYNPRTQREYTIEDMEKIVIPRLKKARLKRAFSAKG